jgi:hypothetical protein
MTNHREQREGPDRRRQPRGGRRTGDVDGFTPLVMVVDSDDRRREISEAILARLKFAVAPVESVDRAIEVIETLRPELIVAGEDHAQRFRDLLAAAGSVPVVVVEEEARVTDALIETVRQALRRVGPQS